MEQERGDKKVVGASILQKFPKITLLLSSSVRLVCVLVLPIALLGLGSYGTNKDKKTS